MSVVSNLPSNPAAPANAAWRSRYFCDLALHYADRFRFPILALVLLAYLAAFNGQWQLEPDAALYLTLGKNIATRRGYTYHGQPHHLGYPGYPYMLAAIFKIFGNQHALYAASAMMVACGLGVLALTYRLVLLYSDRPTAVIITFLVGISRLHAHYCYEMMTDIPLLLGTMAFLAGYEAIFSARIKGRGKGCWYDWIILIAGLALAISTRPTMIGLMAIAVGVTIWAAIRGRLGRAWTVTCIAGVAVAIAIFFFLDPRRGTANGHIQTYEQWLIYVLTHNGAERLHTMADNLKGPFFDAIARTIFGMPLGKLWLNLIFGSAIVIAGLALIRRHALWGLWITSTFIILIVFFPLDRYLLQVLPVLTIACWQGLCWLNRKTPRLLGNLIFTVLLGASILMNGIQFVTIIVHQHRHPFLNHYKEGRYPAYVQASHDLTSLAGENDLILCPQKFSRIMTFLSDRRVVEENETWAPTLPSSRLFVIDDPADTHFHTWLTARGVRMTGPPLRSIPRPNHPPLQIRNALP